MAWGILFSGSLLAGLIQSGVGFGAAPLVMIFLQYQFDIVTAAGISGIICMYISIVIAWRYRRTFLPRRILLPTLCYTAVNVWMICIISSLDLKRLTLVFGAFLILLSAYFLFFSQTFHLRNTPAAAVVCSTVSGACAGLFGVGGPMMALYMLTLFSDWESYICNLQMLFIAANTASLAMRIASGIFVPQLIPITLVGVAGITIGDRIGQRLVRRIPADQIKRLVYLFVGISGGITMLQQLL